MDMEIILPKVIASCDERIKGMADDRKEFEQFEKYPWYETKLNFLDMVEKMLKIEKLIYLSIQKNGKVLDLYCAKYQEILSESYQLSSDMVVKGYTTESKHLAWCSSTLEQQKYIKQVCQYKN
jgi:hypothetical protein